MSLLEPLKRCSYLVSIPTVHKRNLLEALENELPAVGDVSVAVSHLNDGTSIKAKVLIGCDGLHLKVATWLGLKEPVLSGRSAVRGLSVYPEGHGLTQKLQQLPSSRQKGWFLAFK